MSSITSQFNIDEYTQHFNVSLADKLKYGEIHTPFILIKQIFALFDPMVFTQKNKKWLDLGAGRGYFSMYLFTQLNEGLKQIIIDEQERKEHIIQNMIYMVEIKMDHILFLKEFFGENANIFQGDFLSEPFFTNEEKKMSFDYIIGNPPYNANGIKKVPTNTILNKKQEDGQTIWMPFLKKAISLLKSEEGQLGVIVPSIWLKPDKACMFHYLTAYKIEKIHCLTNTETNKLFKGEAQTPTCYFLLTKKETDHFIDIYDTNENKYIHFYCKPNFPIPLFGQHLIQKIQSFVEKAGSLFVYKTNLPNGKSTFREEADTITHPYPNIKTCILHERGIQPHMVINYSNISQAYAGQKKIILAHKMYGFPFLDASGIYGISNRDNYVILRENVDELKKIKEFLSTKLILFIYESTRYRMKYLEKYAFQFIPDITKLSDFPIIINDETIATYFGINEKEKKYMEALHKKNYKNI